MNSSVDGKVIAITGASSGIGEATSLHLAERGAKLILAARGRERLESLAKRVNEAGRQAHFQITDVTRRDDLASLVGLALDKFGRLDALFNNAGIGPISPLDDLQVEDWDAMVEVNIKGVLWGIAAALPIFRKQGFGHFINTASTAGIKTTPNQAVYSGTKFAVRAISEGLRQEVGDMIRVTVITPGFVSTDFVQKIRDTALRRNLTEVRDRMAISPDAIARAVTYALEQPADVDVNEIVIRPTAQQ